MTQRPSEVRRLVSALHPRLVGEFSLQRTQQKAALCLISSVCECDPSWIQRHSSLCAIPFLPFALDHNNRLRPPFNRAAVSKKRSSVELRLQVRQSRVPGSAVGFSGPAVERSEAPASDPAEREELHLPPVAQVLTLSCLAEPISGGRRRHRTH